MNKYYVLNNSLDKSLFLKSENLETRTLSESKQFGSRSLARKYLTKRNLTENYSIKMIVPKRHQMNESMDPKSVGDDVKLAIDDAKDYIDNTIEYLDTCYGPDSELNEECINNSNIADVLEKFRKIQAYMSGIDFTPSFDNSLGSIGGSNE